MRVGIGYDVHPLKKGREFILGGVKIPFSKGLWGHSDADVLFHAAADAVFGALGLPDIGEQFPAGDPRYKGKDSRFFAQEASRAVRASGHRIGNLDCVVIAEKPKLSPYKDEIRRSVARAFQVPPSSVSVKAKTNEGLDAVGRGRAVAAYAVVALEKQSKRKGR